MRQLRQLSQVEPGVFGTVVIGSRRGQQPEITGMARHGKAFVPAVAAGYHFQPHATQFAEFTQQAPQLAAGHAVAGGMGDDRDAAGIRDPLQRLLQ